MKGGLATALSVKSTLYGHLLDPQTKEDIESNRDLNIVWDYVGIIKMLLKEMILLMFDCAFINGQRIGQTDENRLANVSMLSDEDLRSMIFSLVYFMPMFLC